MRRNSALSSKKKRKASVGDPAPAQQKVKVTAGGGRRGVATEEEGTGRPPRPIARAKKTVNPQPGPSTQPGPSDESKNSDSGGEGPSNTQE